MEGLYTASLTRELETRMVQEGTSLWTLMQRAGSAVASRCMEQVPAGTVCVLCGKGNNGGDGFVCAKELAATHTVTVVLVCGEPKTELAKRAFSMLPASVTVRSLPAEEKWMRTTLEGADCIIDAVFGFSFYGELPGDVCEILAAANQQPAFRLAVDMPSGVACDTGTVKTLAFQADETVTFHGKKVGLCSYPGRIYGGRVHVAALADGGVLVSPVGLITQEDAAGVLLRKRDIQSNKGDFGRLCMVCGSYGMAGAAVLAAKAALRTGIGLLELVVDARIYPIVAAQVPEAVYTILSLDTPEQRQNSKAVLQEAINRADACVVGCGLGALQDFYCQTVFAHCQVPLLVDADAINYLAAHPEFRQRLSAETVLTPHPGEMGRLCQCSAQEVQENRFSLAAGFCQSWQGVLVLKGAGTIVATAGQTAINETGNPGMAKGGSGDVLAGIVGSLMAQGVMAYLAAQTGVWLHGAAGDRCAAERSQRGMLPSDLIEALPAIFRELAAD